VTIEIMHIQALTLRGLLARANGLLNTVESVDRQFLDERRACVQDLEQWMSYLTKKMQEASPALAEHFSAGADRAD
jgi:hypothetical protein